MTSPERGGIGRGRLVTGVFFGLAALGGSIVAIRPDLLGLDWVPVAGTDFILAMSASGVIAAFYFLLSSQVRRETAEAAEVARDVEHRTEEAIGALRADVHTLRDAISQQDQRRAAATREAAEVVSTAPTTAALRSILDAGSAAGLIQGSLDIWLRDFIVLSIMTGVVDNVPGIGSWPGTSFLIARQPDDVDGEQGYVDRPQHLASTFLPGHSDLVEGLTDLHPQLRRSQANWRSFPEDVQRGLRWGAGAVEKLTRAIDEADDPLRLGSIYAVISDQHILMRPPLDVSWLSLVDIDQPSNPLAIDRELVTEIDAGFGPNHPALLHPLVQRQLRYERDEIQQDATIEALRAQNFGEDPY